MNNQAETEIQLHTKSEVRATTLSVMGFTTNIILIPFSFLFGWLAAEYSAFAAYKMIALIGVVYLAIWLIAGRRQISKVIR